MTKSSGNDRILLAGGGSRRGPSEAPVGGGSARGEPCVVTEMSEKGAALASGPESRFVVDALDSVLDGRCADAQRLLDAGAAVTSWADVLHRLDVAGRALAFEAALRPCDLTADAARVAALAGACGVDPLPRGTAQVLEAWCRGSGVPVAIDLTTGEVDAVTDAGQAWAATLVLAWLVDRSGFPPQVVA